MRHAATQSLLERNDVIIVASVSCIYGIGSVETYAKMVVKLEVGGTSTATGWPRRWSSCSTAATTPPSSAARSGCAARSVDIYPSHYEDRAWRVTLFGDEIESISEFDPLTGEVTAKLETITVYANSHYVTPRPTLTQAITRHQDRAARTGSINSSPKASCWKPSGCSSAPPSTSK